MNTEELRPLLRFPEFGRAWSTIHIHKRALSVKNTAAKVFRVRGILAALCSCVVADTPMLPLLRLGSVSPFPPPTDAPRNAGALFKPEHCSVHILSAFR